MISACVTGNIGRDADTRDVGDGSVVSFSVASSDGNKEKTTTWVRCEIWGRRGQTLLPHLIKGTRVACSGTLVAREYKARDGSTKTSVDLRVDGFEFLGKRDEGHREEKPRGGKAYNADDQDIPF